MLTVGHLLLNLEWRAGGYAAEWRVESEECRVESEEWI